jgi:hypothetical protein
MLNSSDLRNLKIAVVTSKHNRDPVSKGREDDVSIMGQEKPNMA